MHSVRMVSVNSPFWEALPDDVMEMLYFFDEFFMNKSVCKGDDPGPADRSKQLIQSANGSIPSSFSQSTIVQRSRSGKSTRCAPEGGGGASKKIPSRCLQFKKITYIPED